jgi:hypothetical protein
MTVISFTTNQLFQLLTATRNWYKGDDVTPPFCDESAAGTLKLRHKRGELSEESYEKLFFHFGYKKELVWTKQI